MINIMISDCGEVEMDVICLVTDAIHLEGVNMWGPTWKGRGHRNNRVVWFP